VQVELANRPEHDARRRALREREESLLARHRERWLAGLPQLKTITWLGFERGFPAAIKARDFATSPGTPRRSLRQPPCRAVASRRGAASPC
jgi:hypothetical protein